MAPDEGTSNAQGLTSGDVAPGDADRLPSEEDGGGAEGAPIEAGAGGPVTSAEEAGVEATPAAEEAAEELGVDLRSVEPTGKGGRVTKGDVQDAAGEVK